MTNKKYWAYMGIAALTLALDLILPKSYAGTMFTGEFVGAGSHDASGMASITNRTLTLSNIEVDRVPDGRVYLSMDADYDYSVELGRLTQFSRTVTYTIPANVNIQDYNTVLIWCKKFSVEIGHAALKP